MAARPKVVERAIDQRLDFTFETTLGGTTMARLMAEAASRGIEVYVFYVGLASADAHMSGSGSDSGPAGMTFPKTPSAVATATAAEPGETATRAHRTAGLRQLRDRRSRSRTGTGAGAGSAHAARPYRRAARSSLHTGVGEAHRRGCGRARVIP